MSFKIDIPNYKAIKDGDYYYSSLPNGFWSELPQFILRHCDDDEEGVFNMLREMSNISLVKAPEFASNDMIDDFICKIKSKSENDKLHIVFDCLGAIVKNISCSCEELNEFLEEHKIGYICSYNFHDVGWEKNTENVIVDKIDELQMKVKTVSEDAYEKISRLKDKLYNSNDEMVRKEILQNAIGMVEALLKNKTGKKEFKNAVQALIDRGIGDKKILRYGITLWNFINNDIPECRHGVQDKEKVSLSKETSSFWINEIMNYAKYITDICLL